MRRFGAQAAGAALILLLLGQTETTTAADQWREVKSTEAKFAISFPATAKVTRKKTKSGRPVITYALDLDGASYRASFQQLGPAANEKDAERIFNAVRRDLLRDKRRKLISERKLSFGRAPGRELRLNIQAGSTVVVLTLRMYIRNNRFYQVSLGTERGKEKPAYETRYFRSFRIL